MSPRASLPDTVLRQEAESDLRANGYRDIWLGGVFARSASSKSNGYCVRFSARNEKGVMKRGYIDTSESFGLRITAILPGRPRLGLV